MSIRLIIIILATFGPFIQVAQRYNMSIAIVAMVNNSAYSVAESNASHSEGSCPAKEVNATRQLPEGKLLWNPSLQGIILSAYFYGYTATQIVGGRLAERWGAKITCGLGVLLASIGTLLTPFTTEYIILVFLVRLMIGAFHGFMFSSLFTVFNNWIPENERATVIGSMMAGSNLGGAVALPLVSYICSSEYLGGWRTSFYVLASFGCVWSIAWYLLMTDLPENHSKITDKELKFINENIRSHQKTNNVNSAPWIKIITSPAVMASAVAKTTGTFSYYVLTIELPLYLENVLHAPIKENGFLNSYMYLAVTVTLFVSGRVADLMKSRSLISTTILRKIFQAFGIKNFLPFNYLRISAALSGQILMALIPFSGCEQKYVITCIILSMGIYGFIGGGEMPIIPEFASKYSGTVFGFSNFFASCTGILTPIFVGLLLDENIHDRERWNVVFITCACASGFGMIFFSIFATSVPQKWAQE